MISEETKILAMVECLLLWDYLSRHGGHKHEAIEKLYRSGRLSREYYDCGCPFCYYFDFMQPNCNKCIWPGTGDVRCQKNGSPYNHWRVEYRKSSQAARQAAKKMLQFLLAIEI